MPILLDDDGKKQLGPAGQLMLGETGDDCDCACDADCDIPLDTEDATSAYAVDDFSLITSDPGCVCGEAIGALANNLLSLTGANQWTSDDPGIGQIAGREFNGHGIVLLPSHEDVLDGLCPFWYLTVDCRAGDASNTVWAGIKTTGVTAAGIYTFFDLYGLASCATGTPATMTVS